MDPDPPPQSKLRLVLLILCVSMAAAICGAGTLASGAGSPTDADAPLLLVRKSILWISLVGFLLLSGFFSSSETALFSLNKLQLHTMEQAGRRGMRSVRRLLDEPNETLVTILACNTFVNIAATLSGAALVETYFQGQPVLSFVLGALLVASLILIFGEITPKTFAIERAESLALITAPLLLLVSNVIKPLRGAVMRVSRVLFKVVGVPMKVQEWSLTEEELRALLTFGEVESVLEEDEQDMIAGVLEMGETMVEEIMTPRTEIVGFPVDTPQQEMIENMKKAVHSRVLIYGEDLDHVVGLLFAKDFLLDPEKDYRDLIREPIVVPTKKKVIRLLEEFKSKRMQFAVVVDEYGGTAGIVTMHDLLEEIVGEIRDRGQKGTLEEIIRIKEGEFLVPGKSEIWFLNEELGLNLTEELGRTLSGYIINVLGHFPKKYETLEHEGYLFRVLRVEHHRIVHVHVLKRGGEGKADEEQRLE